MNRLARAVGTCLLGLGGLSLVAGCGAESPKMSETSHVQTSTGGDIAPPAAVAPMVRYSTAEERQYWAMKKMQQEQERLADDLAKLQQCIRTQQVVPTWHC